MALNRKAKNIAFIKEKLPYLPNDFTKMDEGKKKQFFKIIDIYLKSQEETQKYIAELRKLYPTTAETKYRNIYLDLSINDMVKAIKKAIEKGNIHREKLK